MVKYQNGNKHGEGYEQEYIDAYLCLSNAILSAKKMTKSDVNITGLTNKRDSVKKALIVAKKELEGKINKTENKKNKVGFFSSDEDNGYGLSKSYTSRIEPDEIDDSLAKVDVTDMNDVMFQSMKNMVKNQNNGTI